MQDVKKTREETETKRFFLFVLRRIGKSRKKVPSSLKKTMNSLRRGEMMTKSERERGESKEDAIQSSETLAVEDKLNKSI